MAKLPNGFTAWDYVVFAATLIISMGIGVYFALAGKKQKTQGDYLLGGRSMSVFPVAVSLLVSFQSAVVMLGNPAEIYQQGTEFYLSAYGSAAGYALGGLLFVPLLYPLKLTSAYEYYERRFNSRAVRLMGTAFMAFGQVIFMAIGTFAPATAMEAVTGFPVWANLLITGLVATFYTTIGGMKAVVWTDVFQSFIMMGGILCIIIQGIVKIGSFGRTFEITDEWDRLRFFNWNLDPRIRHTVWGLIIGNAFSWMGNSGLSQASVQRYSSLPTLRKAQTTVLVNVFGMMFFTTLTCFSGVVLFAYYAGQNCDLMRNRLVDNPNQLIPYFVMDLLAYPTVPGLFMSSLFSGALSTISSSLNALAAIVWDDILKPRYAHLPEERKTFIIKCLVGTFGCSSCFVSFGLLYLEGTVVQMAISLVGPSNGTLTGIFLLGALFPFANKYGALAGGIAGIVVSIWQAIGSYVNEISNLYLVLPYPNGTCGVNTTSDVPEITSLTTTTITSTMASIPDSGGDSNPLENFYRISYMWITTLAIVCCVLVGLVVSLLTRPFIPEEERKVPKKYQLPLFSRLCCCLPTSVKYYLNCCRDFEDEDDDDDAEDVQKQKTNDGTGHKLKEKTPVASNGNQTSVEGDANSYDLGNTNKGFQQDDIIEMTRYKSNFTHL